MNDPPGNRSHPSVLGLDIGGANLKAAYVNGITHSMPFALWKNPRGLPAALAQLRQQMPAHVSLAVTMTGELCDCFATKRQGVQAILDAVEASAGSMPIRVWQNDGRLVDLATARATPLKTAAANWLALATWAGRHVPEGAALLIDIGSTTTDIIPLLQGRPVPMGRTDPERLRSRELVYTGVRRTPVCALLGGEGAAEFFATTLDVNLVLGTLAEDPANSDTADGRPATMPAAQARLARMLCADEETCTIEEVRELAQRIQTIQANLIGAAVQAVSRRLPEPPARVILAGSGEFLARSVLDLAPQRVLSLNKLLGPGVSEAACAFAVAVLAAEESA